MEKLDAIGFFSYSEDGKKIIFGKGKHKGQPVINHYWYLHWIKNESTLPEETKVIARKIMSEFKEIPPPTYGR